MRNLCRVIGISAALLLAGNAFAQPAPPPSMVVSPDRANGIYATGETVHWKAEWVGTGEPPTVIHYVLKAGGLKEVQKGDVKLTEKSATFDTRFDGPGTVLAEVTWQPGVTNRAVGGAVADPYKIQPAAPEPKDFEAFWSRQLKTLKGIPPNAKLTPEDSTKPGVQYAKITLDNINGTHVQGQIARPLKGEKFPAILIPQWAGVYALDPSWVTNRAANGWLALNIEAHDIPIDREKDFYTKLYGNGGALQYYWKIDNDDREKSYYLRMYLSACQAVEYLKQRPDWDGKTLVVMGASQGGQQTLVIAGLYPNDVTAALAFVPAACDMLAPSIGRASGFPNWWTQTDSGRDPQKVHDASQYFDPVYFAARIHCPALVGFGLRDEVAPPSSVLAAVNQIQTPKDVMILAKSGHQDENGTQRPFNDRLYGVWLPALQQGHVPPMK